MKFAYIRVSSLSQDTEIQRSALPSDIQRVYEEKVSGASTKNREQLKLLISNLRKNDYVWCFSMDRLSRNCVDLLQIVDEITKNKQASIYFNKEQLSFYPDDQESSSSITNRFLLQVLSACSEMERQNIRFRQALGILEAQKKGLYKGRQYALKKEDVIELQQMYQNSRTSISVLAKKFHISRSSCYRYLKKSNTNNYIEQN